MNKAEFIQTLSGYVPEKLIDTLAESAEWDGLFYEESESKPDKQDSDHDLNIVPFMTSDIGNRGHRQKVQRTFKELRAKIKGKANDFSTNKESISKPPEMIEYAERNEIKIPDYVAKQKCVNGKQLAKALKKLPILSVSPHMRNMTVNELLYLLTYKESGKD